MSIIQNKDIYDPSKGNPFKPILEMLDILDQKIESTKKHMVGLESTLRSVNKTGSGAEAKIILENTTKLNAATERLNALTKAEQQIKQQLIATEAKLVASYSAEAEQLNHVKIETQVLNKQNQEAVKLASQLIGAYEKESIKLNQLRKSYKDLALSGKENSKEAKELIKQIGFLDNKLKSVDASVGQFQRNVGNYTGALNKFGNGILQIFGIGGALTVVQQVLSGAFNTVKDFQIALASLSAITGASGDDLKFLEDKAREMSDQYGKSATEIVDAFKLIGSQKPELLKNAQALQQVTDKVMILSDATGLDLTTSASAVTAVMSQFGLSAEKASAIIDTLAAGSLEGSAEVNNITESLKNFGTVANDSNLTVAQSVALIELLGEKQIFGAEAGTKLRGATLKLKEANLGYESGVFNMNDAIDDANEKLSKLGTQTQKDAYLQKLFGIENITVGSILLQNKDKFNQLTIAVQKSGVAIEQANKNNNTLAKDLNKASTAWSNFVLSIENGSGPLSNAFRALTQRWTEFLKSGTEEMGESWAEAKIRLIDKLKDAAWNLVPGLQRAIDKMKEFFGIKEETAKGKLNPYMDRIYKMQAANKLALKQLDEMKKASKEANQEEEKTKTANIKTKINSPEIDLGKYYSERNKLAEENKNILPIFNIGINEIGNDVVRDAVNLTKRVNESVAATNDEFRKAEKLKEQEVAEQYIKIRQQLLTESIKYAENIFSQSQDNKLQKIKDDINAEKKILEQQYEDKIINETQYKIRIAELNKREREEEARADKKKALFDILINTAVAVAKSITKPWLIPGILLSSAIQAAAVAAAPIKFAEGTDYVNGPGTETSDSVFARLSKGERVVPAEINKQLMGISNKDLPKVINSGMNTLRLEKLLNKVNENTSISAYYLSNLEIHHEDSKYKYFKDVKTGITHRIIKD